MSITIYIHTSIFRYSCMHVHAPMWVWAKSWHLLIVVLSALRRFPQYDHCWACRFLICWITLHLQNTSDPIVCLQGNLATDSMIPTVSQASCFCTWFCFRWDCCKSLESETQSIQDSWASRQHRTGSWTRLCVRWEQARMRKVRFLMWHAYRIASNVSPRQELCWRSSWLPSHC